MALTDDLVLEALGHVFEPDLGRDLVSLNMVKHVTVDAHRVRVGIELAAPNYPLKDALGEEIKQELGKLDGVRQVDITWSVRAQPAGAPPPTLPGVRNSIAVGAGKGGVGKSTIAVLAALGLRRQGAKVGLLDADVYGPSIPKMLGIEGQQPATRGPRIVPIEAHGLRVMSMGFLLEPEKAVIWRGPMVHGVVKQFIEQVEWGELDYLIIDLPPGTGDVPLTLSQTIPMAGAVVVCTPQDLALLDAVRALRMYQQLNVGIVGIVENMSYFAAPDTGKIYDLFGRGGARAAAERIGVPCLGEIPINISIRVAGDQGTPVENFERTDSATRSAIHEFVRNLAERVEAMNVSRPAAPELRVT